MATPADQRLLELLDKWLKSLELHVKYSSLDDASYWSIQPWAEHQRPSRWIIDLARQKAIALQAQVQERIEMGDAAFGDALESMIFLANLVGSEHIERFIPVAEVEGERASAPPPPHDAPPASSGTGTHEMPTLAAGRPRAPPPSGTVRVARTERNAPPKAGPAAPAEGGGPSQAARDQVIADAVRLVQWGRKWYELAEIIAHMAGRPPLPDVRRILKDNKSSIDEQAASR